MLSFPGLVKCASADDADALAGRMRDAMSANARHDAKKVALKTLGISAAAGGGLAALRYALGSKFVPSKDHSDSNFVPNEVVTPHPIKRADADPVAYTKKLLTGEKATDVNAVPWAAPAAVTAGITATIGGYHAMNALANSRRKKHRQQGISDAKREFEDALMSQYQTPGQKAAGEKSAGTRLGECLDAIHSDLQEMRKSADVSDTLGTGLGVYGALAAPVALGVGALVYDKSKKRQRRALLDKAVRERAISRSDASPVELSMRMEPR